MKNDTIKNVTIGLLLLSALFAWQTIVYAANTPDVKFKFQGTDGKSHQSEDYKGRWTVVNFWATWCSPCIREIPELKHFDDEFRDKGVSVLGVNYEELTMDQLQQAVKDFKITYPVLYLTAESEMSDEMVLKGLPSTFVISPEGKLEKTWVGPVEKEDLIDFIQPKLSVSTTNVSMK